MVIKEPNTTKWNPDQIINKNNFILYSIKDDDDSLHEMGLPCFGVPMYLADCKYSVSCISQ